MSKGGVENSSTKPHKLSSEQATILRMLTEEFETPKTISYRRKTTVQAVYKTITKLRKKGYLSKGFNRGLKKSQPTKSIQPPTTKLQNGIRLHGQEFNCKIIYKSISYDKIMQKKHLIYLDDNTVRLYRNSIEVYSSPQRSFFAEDEQRTYALSIQYWNKIFNQLENKLNIILIKDINTNIRQVNAHYALIQNGLAKEYNKNKVRLRIFARDDGKLWFQIDNSYNLHEAEFLHSGTAKQDTTNVKRFFSDIRDNSPPTMTQLTGTLNTLVHAQAYYAEHIKSHVGAIQTLDSSIKRLSEVVEQLKN